MELKEIQTLAISPAISTPFAASWSEDDKISIITEKGLYIVEVVPDPGSAQPLLDLHHTWLQPSTYYPTSETGFDCDQMLWKLDQHDVYRMVLDSYLAPMLAMTKSVNTYVVQVAWSPAGMFQYGRCLLATVTNYGCVLVHMPRMKHWPVVVNISSLWANHCSENWNEEGLENFEVLKERVEKLKATAATWSSVMDDGGKKFGLLMVGLQNGNIVVWRLNSVGLNRDRDVDTQIMLCIETKLQRVTALHWRATGHQTGWLCVGDNCGTILMLSLSMMGTELQHVSTTEVWPHSDRIQVSNILSLPPSTEEDLPVTLVAIKSGFVVAVALDSEGQVVGNCSYLVGNLAVTGIEIMNNETLLVVTQSGSSNKLHIKGTGAELKIEAETLNAIKLQQSACYGIAASHNKAIFCQLTSFCTLFDHLIQREPAQLTFSRMCGKDDPYTALLRNSSESLQKHWDYLELLRLQDPLDRGVDLMSTDDLDRLSTYNLKILLWLTKFAALQSDPEEDGDHHAALIQQESQIERLVVNRHICTEATALMSKEVQALSPESEQSLALFLMWLRKVDSETQTSGPTSTAIKNILQKANEYKQLPEDEICSMCGLKCNKMENCTKFQCPAGHILPRCSHTFHQCSEVPSWICKVCNSIAHPTTCLMKIPICIYCDRVLYLDDRFLLFGNEEDEEEEEEKVGVQEESDLICGEQSMVMATEDCVEGSESVVKTEP